MSSREVECAQSLWAVLEGSEATRRSMPLVCWPARGESAAGSEPRAEDSHKDCSPGGV